VQAVARDEQWFITAVALALEQAAVLVDSRLAHEVFLVAQVEVLEVVLHTARDSNMRLQHAARGLRDERHCNSSPDSDVSAPPTETLSQWCKRLLALEKSGQWLPLQPTVRPSGEA
jgi:hypothetical protein